MSEPIRFYYRGAVQEVRNAAPTQTVLQHLREDLHCTGTKEGCAEGDCGACTVVIGSLVVIGGLLAATFGTDALVVDTSLDSFELVTEQSMLVGAAAVFVSFLLGGWAAGRSARFDGVANGLVTVVWVLLIGVVFAGLSGIACIHFLIRFIERIGLLPFTLYRLLIAALIVWHFA